MRLSKFRLPISLQLTIWFSLSLLLVLAVFGVFVYWYADLADPGWPFAGALITAVIASKGIGYALARRVLSPISEMSGAADQIGSSDISRRLPVPGGPDDELSELARTFNGLIDRLEDSLQRERQFSEDVAHELLTPLARLRPEIEMAVRDDASSDEMRRTLRQVLGDIDDLTEVVRGLMDLSRAELHEIEACEAVDMSEVAQKCLQEYRSRARERSIDLSGDWETSVHVRADEVRLQEVFGNLLDNAIKYTPEGGHVRLNVRRVNGWGRARIEDDGIGFNPELRDAIFDRFNRSDRNEVESQEGSGLGLSIVQTLVEGWSGRVWAESPGPGRGATFVVDLPQDGGRYDPSRQ